MVDRVLNRIPTPDRVQSFLPAVWSAHIDTCVVYIGRATGFALWLAGESLLP